jgi:hypothetical protein
VADLVLGTWKGRVSYHRNDGDGTFTVAQESLVEVPGGRHATPALGDLTGNGRLDLVVGAADGSLHFYRNTGSASTPSFEHVPGVLKDRSLGSRSAPALHDVDGDGTLDLVVGTEEELVVLQNTGTPSGPSFDRAPEPVSVEGMLRLAHPSVGDLNGDGRPEVVPGRVAGVPMRPLVSVAAVAGFVGLNLLGARTTGAAENVLVALKVGILVGFGVLGLVYAFGFSGASFGYGVDHVGGFGPVIAAAISFVSFQGWQLLFYDQESIEEPVDTIRKAVYVSIPVAVVIYILVGMVTVNLVPEALQAHPHVALKDAASMMMRPYGLAHVGAVVLALSALFSTGSAINATLFSSAHFAKGMLSDDLLPDRIGDSDADGVPERTVLVLGAITAAFTWYGSLRAITSFASLSFILVFGAMSYLAFRQRDHDGVNGVIPAVGTVGSLAFFPLMLYNLYTREPNTFYMVLGIAIGVIAVELLYFERELIEEEVTEFDPAVETVLEDE